MRCLVEHALQPELGFEPNGTDHGPNGVSTANLDHVSEGHMIELVARKARKRALRTIEVSTTFPYASNPSKLDTCWYMLAGNDESDTYLCNLSEDSVHPIRKI